MQRDKVDELLMLHIQEQYKRWPDLTVNALKEAIKVVKGQFRIEANKKKICKSLVFELIMHEIVEDHIKNKKRILIKVRELITSFGKKDSRIILNNC